MKKTLWRCHVCNDLHYGLKPPMICPTCGAKNAFVRVDFDESTRLLGSEGEVISTQEKVIAAWREFADQSPLFKLTQNDEEIALLSSGVLENMKNRGLKYCPCRIPSGDFEKDLALICPCNFLKQKNWAELGECWCGLFVKREQ